MLLFSPFGPTGWWRGEPAGGDEKQDAATMSSLEEEENGDHGHGWLLTTATGRENERMKDAGGGGGAGRWFGRFLPKWVVRHSSAADLGGG